MGTDKDTSQVTAAELRRRAEERLKAIAPEAGFSPRDNEIRRLFHELQVHQIELEMQNAELRQARDEVEAALEGYTDLYDFAPVGYFTLDHDGTINAVNLTGAGLLGIERSRLLGRRFELFVADESRPQFAEVLGQVFASQGKKSCEVTLTGDGNHRQFVQIEAVSNASGKECHIAVLDITGRRSAEEALAEKRRELEELNRFLEERIGKAVDELRQKDLLLILKSRQALMGEMIDSIAHQWRQPLNSLGLVVQQVELFYDTGEVNREFIQENTARAMDLVRHMSRTIDDFRNFFRPDKEPVSFSANQVIAQTLSLIEKSFTALNIRIALHIEGDPMIKGYPNEYSQVLLNIIMNARDALVAYHVDDALISIRVFAEGSSTVVTIGDNASGIPEEIIDRLFDPYFTTKGPDEGSGIGLFISKTIIEENMGGRLTVRNTGSGAEFRIEV